MDLRQGARANASSATEGGAAHAAPEPQTPATPIGHESFRAAMRDLAGAVSIVTTSGGERRTGCIVSSLQSYSVAPPILLVSLGRESSTAKLLAETGRFGVSLLSHAMREVADGFSGPNSPSGDERFRHGQWKRLAPEGQWVAEGALAAFDCAVDEMIPRHSHVIVLGKVLTMTSHAPDDRPLLYWRRAYHDIARPD